MYNMYILIQVRDRLCDFRDARWDDLLDELDGDVLVVTR